MMNFKRTLKAALFLGALGLGTQALATPITYTVTGRVNAGATGAFSALVNEVITARYTVDASLATFSGSSSQKFQEEDDGGTKLGKPAQMIISSFTVDGHTFSATPAETFSINDDLTTLGGALAMSSLGEHSFFSVSENESDSSGGNSFNSLLRFDDLVDQLMFQPSGSFPTDLSTTRFEGDFQVTQGGVFSELTFTPASITGPGVPEPMTYGLLALGFLGLAFGRRGKASVLPQIT